MTDTLSSELRSTLMSRVRTKDTGIERLVRGSLHAKGFRYRLGGGDLPGRPDIVLPRYRAVVFVHGCFWHGHDCPLFRLPRTRPEFWDNKIRANRDRDIRNALALLGLGWRVATVWECALRDRDDGQQLLGDGLATWLGSDESSIEMRA